MKASQLLVITGSSIFSFIREKDVILSRSMRAYMARMGHSVIFCFRYFGRKMNNPRRHELAPKHHQNGYNLSSARYLTIDSKKIWPIKLSATIFPHGPEQLSKNVVINLPLASFSLRSVCTGCLVIGNAIEMFVFSLFYKEKAGEIIWPTLWYI